MFGGSIVAIVTPMKGGEVDEVSLRRLLAVHRDAGTNGIVPAGCTGEAATLTFDERMRILEICLEEMGDETPVIPGTGSNSTRETIRLTSAARRAGAHGVLIITPYYNKPTPEGQLRHYLAVADEVDVPIVVYNVPGRTGTDMLPETIARLAEHPNIVAIKEAGGSVDRVSAILELSDITVLSGDDPLTLPMMAVGASGVVSVVANVLPSLVREMVAAQGDDPSRALTLHRTLRPVSNALFLESNPGPVKHAMAELGMLDSGELRPPLTEVREATARAMAPVIENIRKLAANEAP